MYMVSYAGCTKMANRLGSLEAAWAQTRITNMKESQPKSDFDVFTTKIGSTAQRPAYRFHGHHRRQPCSWQPLVAQHPLGSAHPKGRDIPVLRHSKWRKVGEKIGKWGLQFIETYRNWDLLSTCLLFRHWKCSWGYSFHLVIRFVKASTGRVQLNHWPSTSSKPVRTFQTPNHEVTARGGSNGRPQKTRPLPNHSESTRAQIALKPHSNHTRPTLYRSTLLSPKLKNIHRVEFFKGFEFTPSSVRASFE